MPLDPPGFFGKVPARGDFLGRRIPPALAETWDAWLGRLTLAVRAAAGDDWPEAWLTAPLWHFALGARLAPPSGAAGVLVASVDRVGRMFPFTLIGPADGIPDPAWSEALETEILAALEDGFDPDTLDAALLHLGPPPPGAPSGASLDPAASLWWCRGSDRMAATRHILPGLPEGDQAVAMVLGTSEPPPNAPQDAPP